mmetsp:Transcript_3814/g.8253  ORF Transcript_3814/g.8253 Transcript_3814/m.8253 type:complete len:148 (+) Transcript_3814:22-465(+)
MIATFASLANVAPPSSAVDSVDVSATFLHKKTVRDTNLYYRGKDLMAVRVGPYKAHFATHSGFGTEPVVAHDPPLVFQVEHDPSERYNVTAPADVLQEIMHVKAEHQASLVYGVPQLDMIDYHAMDCKGLPASVAGCCQSPLGKCSV